MPCNFCDGQEKPRKIMEDYYMWIENFSPYSLCFAYEENYKKRNAYDYFDMSSNKGSGIKRVTITMCPICERSLKEK
jgi:hypothetical protein